MAKLLMITGLGSGKDLASGKKGAFYNTLEEFHKYWERIDIIVPKIKDVNSGTKMIFDNVNLHISSWPLIFHPIFFLKKGLEIYREQKFDLMTVHEFPPFYNGIGARLLWQKIKVPYVLEIHHIPGYPKSADVKEKLYKLLVKWFIKYDSSKAKIVRVVNKKQTPDFLRKAGIKEEKIKYIPSMYIDIEKFKKIDTDKKYDLIFVARIEKNKGIFELIDAVKEIKKDKSDISLLLVGKGSLEGEIKKYIEEKKLKENVHLTGWVEDLALAYNSARIFVNPSFNEGGPRVSLEAMACGLPIITTKVGLMVDLIIDGENGLFVDWDPFDMSDKIIKLLNRIDLQNNFSIRSRKIASQFDKKTEIVNYATKVQQLLR